MSCITKRRLAMAMMLSSIGVMVVFSGCARETIATRDGTPLPITATAGIVSVPLPSTIPLPAHAVLVREYGGTLNAHTATVWGYTVVGKSNTPASVIAYYESAMPANGWTAAVIPPETAQGKYGGTALAYQQSGQVATIAAGVDQQYPQAVLLLITVTG